MESELVWIRPLEMTAVDSQDIHLVLEGMGIADIPVEVQVEVVDSIPAALVGNLVEEVDIVDTVDILVALADTLVVVGIPDKLEEGEDIPLVDMLVTDAEVDNPCLVEA